MSTYAKNTPMPRVTPEQRAFIIANYHRGPQWLADQLRPITTNQIRVVMVKHRKEQHAHAA